MMKRNTKKGFTLVELLAVIVILAIILVIAVPQIMDTIKDTTKASFESSAKMVAAQVENQYTVAQTLSKEFLSTGSCMQKWAGLNDTDYASCTYKIESDGTAKVTLVGKGKFNGLSVCEGTRSSATATSEECSISSEVGGCDTLYWDGNTEGVVSVEWLYKISDLDIPNDKINGSIIRTIEDNEEVELVVDSATFDFLYQSGYITEDYVVIGELLTIVRKPNYTIPDGLTFEEAGIYFIKDNAYIKSLTIPGYTGFPHSENCGH